MLRALGIIFSIILTSLYLFPFEMTYLPGMNTKMIMAGISLVLIPYVSAKKNQPIFPSWFLVLSCWAAVVSIIGLFAVVFNETNDLTYATYIISMWVWLGGAFTLNYTYTLVHKDVTVHIIIRYMVIVCVCQCFIALAVDNNSAIKDFVDSLVLGEGFMGTSKDRMYGIGASLDVAGIRFSAVLIMIASLLPKLFKDNSSSLLEQFLLLASFMIISVIGNMMARTTTIGITTAVVTFYIVYKSFHDKTVNYRSFYLIGFVIISSICIVAYFYNLNHDFQDRVRFGFEGFFSLAETGEWQVHSNEILENMVVWPDSMKTWLIGDGYFNNPYSYDEYYVGPNFAGFYMATDIGYLRFIYYFGVFGTLAFIFFMWEAAKACINKFPAWKIMFAMLLLLNYVIWFKVSSDIFSIFAIFLTMQGVSATYSTENKTIAAA